MSVIIHEMDQAIFFGGRYLFLAVPIIFIVLWVQAAKKQKIEQALALVTGLFFAALLDKMAGRVFYDPRPFLSHNVAPLIQHSADNGFPSEHTLFCFTIATAILFYRRNLGIIALLISLLVGISRVAADVHSPIDIIGGIVIGLAAGSGGYLAAKKLLQRKAPTKSATDQK